MNQRQLRLGRLIFLGTMIVLAACRSQVMQEEWVTPTAATSAAVSATEVSEIAAATEEVAAVATETAVATVPPTWTPAPTEPPPATSTPLPTVTLAPTETPLPLPTNTPIPTATSTPTSTPVLPTNTPAPTSPPAQPTVPADPVLGVNLLPNASFEEGWYNQDGIPELQLPNGWGFDWDTGPTGFGSQSWDVYVRPETRVLPDAQLPPNERPLFVYDGSYTVKIFKGSGAISFRMYTDVTLDPGTYIFEVNVFPDQVMDYVNGEKIWAQDPNSGEIRLWAGDRSTDWLLLTFGQRNTRTYTFTVDQTQSVRVGVWGRGRYAIPNNGFFFDAFSLKKVEG